MRTLIGHLLIKIILIGLPLLSSSLLGSDFAATMAVRVSKDLRESAMSGSFSLSGEFGWLDRISDKGFGIGLNGTAQTFDVSRLRSTPDSLIEKENPFLNADKRTMDLKQYGVVSTYYDGSVTYNIVLGKGGYVGPGVSTAHDQKFVRALVGYSILHPYLNPIDFLYNKDRSSPVNGRLEFNASLEVASSKSRPCITIEECSVNPKVQDHLHYVTFQVGLGWIVPSTGH